MILPTLVLRIRNHNIVRNFSLGLLRSKQELSLSNSKLRNDVCSKISSLYVPGRFGADIYQTVKPIIDVNNIAENISMIRSSCKARAIEIPSADFVSALRDWESKRDHYVSLAERNQEYVTELERLKSLNLTSEYESYNEEYSKFIDALKEEREILHDADEIALPLAKSIPNIIDSSTPIASDIIETRSSSPLYNTASFSHADIGNKLNALQFVTGSPTAYYLSGLFADLELGIQNYFYERLHNSDYFPLACIDFCKSFIVEAIGLDPYSPHHCITLKSKLAKDRGQRLHLVGGASFESFCAYLVNMNIGVNTLPAKYFSLGRRYNAQHGLAKSLDLFSVVQSTNIHCLSLCKLPDEGKEFNSLFEFLDGCYQDLKMPYRIVSVCARNLNVMESRRKQIELWSPHLQKYIEVAHVSQHGDFISKRLNITYGVEHIVEDHCCIVQGVAVNVPVVIGCLVENFMNSNNCFQLPAELQFLQDFIPK